MRSQGKEKQAQRCDLAALWVGWVDERGRATNTWTERYLLLSEWPRVLIWFVFFPPLAPTLNYFLSIL